MHSARAVRLGESKPTPSVPNITIGADVTTPKAHDNPVTDCLRVGVGLLVRTPNLKRGGCAHRFTDSFTDSDQS